LINFYPLEIPLIEGGRKGEEPPLALSEREYKMGASPCPHHRKGMEGNQKQGKFII